MQRLPDFDGLRFILCLRIATFHYSFRIPIDNEFITSVVLRFSYFTDIFLSYRDYSLHAVPMAHGIDVNILLFKQSV